MCLRHCVLYQGCQIYAAIYNTVEPLYSGHHWNQHFVHYSKVSLTPGPLVGMVLRNWAVECNVAAFSELSLAVHWQGRLSRGLVL